MTATTLDSIKTAFSQNKVLSVMYRGLGPANAATPAWQSGWYTQVVPAVGGDPAAGSGTPGAGGTAYTNATGGILFPDSADTKRLIEWTHSNEVTAPYAVKLIDRLVGVGSIAVNSTGDKNVNSVALPRYASGEGVEVYVEIQTAGTTTIPVVSLSSYTNQDGTGGRVGATTTAFNSATSVKGTLQGPLALQAGDTGVKSVETLNVATAGGGSGVVNIILVKTLCWSGGSTLNTSGMPHTSRISPLPFLDMPQIFDGATIQWFRKGANSNVVLGGYVKVVIV